MAFYTPPSLPRTPSAFAMAATLPSLPAELLSSWSLWPHKSSLQQQQQRSPLTPPMSPTFQPRRAKQSQLSLPPIAYLERQLAARAPLTPPEDVFPQKQSPVHRRRLSPRLPKIANDEPVEQPFSKPKNAGPYTDWLDISRTRPAHFLAEKTCEMICYLWFATSSPQQQQSYPTPNNSPPFSQRPNPATTTLQLVATPTFVQFMQKLLETTQVSQSVIVLSLHYIYRLKDRNRFTPAQPGSEFRIAVAGLMMANKFLDDNTYTNKTWSEVSGIELVEINRMEREFLMGVDFNLYVDKPTYESWLNLLKGLVLAKERDSRHFRKSRGGGLVRSSKLSNPHNTTASTGPVSRTYHTSNTSSRYRTSHSHSLRARSTSPSSQTTRPTAASYVYPSSLSHGRPQAVAAVPEPVSPTPRSCGSNKRSAAAAFSPTTASFSQIPTKRVPPVAITLQIPEFNSTTSGGPHSHSPLEGLQSFATMSIDSPHSRQTGAVAATQALPAAQHTSSTSSQWVPPRSVPETLVTPYPVNEGRRTAVPQNLYFYTLACSPMDREEENRTRKGKLRYHQPPPPSSSSATSCYYNNYHPHNLPQPALPPMVQSASTSPNDHHMHVTSTSTTSTTAHQYTLPHFHDTQWTRPPTYNSTLPATTTTATFDHNTNNNTLPLTSTTLPPISTSPINSAIGTPTPTAAVSRSYVPPSSASVSCSNTESPVPSAPFANAGPPGVHFYPTPVLQQQQHCAFPASGGWVRGRRF